MSPVLFAPFAPHSIPPATGLTAAPPLIFVPQRDEAAGSECPSTDFHRPNSSWWSGRFGSVIIAEATVVKGGSCIFHLRIRYVGSQRALPSTLSGMTPHACSKIIRHWSNSLRAQAYLLLPQYIA